VSAQNVSLLRLMTDPALFGSVFGGPSWAAWRAVAAAIDGLPPESDEAAALIRRCTGRTTLPSSPASEVFVPVGRRGGKDRFTSLVVVARACFRDYSDILGPGERGVVMLTAADRKQARVAKRYIRALLRHLPALEAMVERETAEVIDLSNGVSIEIHAASYARQRGYTLVAYVANELAFWQSADDSANPDREVLNAVRPAMATVPGALLMAISSPYARRGELWRAYREHFGQDADPVLVWQADTRTMNPLVPQSFIDRAYADDDTSARAEYGAEFRSDLEQFITTEVLDNVVVPDRHRLPCMANVRYSAFCDPSGGASDSMTLAIGHHGANRLVLDCVEEITAPFDPTVAVGQLAARLRHYGVTTIHGDYYGGEWVSAAFSKERVSYRVAEKPKTELYREALPALTSGAVELLDHPTLKRQLLALERRVTRNGREIIDHPPRGRDDVANAVAGLIATAAAHANRGPYAVGVR
jgi:hypothetical protein